MEKNLTTEESLDLIARMISTTRRNFNDRGGAMFLIWGYTTIAITIAVYTTFTLTQSYHPAMELWLALPVIGGILTWLHHRKFSQPVTTQLDKAVWAVWIAFSAATFACMAVGFTPGRLWPNHSPFPILFVISLMISMATASTGLIIKFRPAAVAGFVGIALAFLTWIFNHMEQLLIFAGLMLVVQVIPGHLLNAACRKEARENAGGTTKNGTATVGAAKNGRASL